MNNFLTLLKKAVANAVVSNSLMALVALVLLSNRVFAQSENVKLDYFSLALANQDEKPKAMFFFQEVLGANLMTNNDQNIYEFELPNSPVIRVFKKEKPEPNATCNYNKSVENWGTCINSYGLAWIVVATSDLKRTAKELKAAGYPTKFSKSMLPDEPTTEVLITSPFNNQLFLFVRREDVSASACKIENIHLGVENLKKSIGFYSDTMGASDIEYVSDVCAKVQIGGQNFILAEPEGLLLEPSQFEGNTSNEASVIKEHFGFLFNDFEQGIYAINGKGYYFKNMPQPQYRDNKHSHFSNGQILSPDGLVIDLGDMAVSRYSRQ